MNWKIFSVIAVMLFASIAGAAAPVIDIEQPNNGENISDSVLVIFGVSDPDNDNLLTADLYYSQAKGNTEVYITTLDLTDPAICSDDDITYNALHNTTRNVCSYTWNTSGIAGHYYVDIEVEDDAFESDINSSELMSEIDGIPPEASNGMPLAFCINANENIIANIEDLNHSVDAASISLTYDSTSSGLATYTTADSELTFSEPGLAFNPPAPYNHNDYVSVTINASDTFGTAMPPYNWTFRVDLEAPEFSNFVVENDGYSGDNHQAISFTVTDSGSGFDNGFGVQDDTVSITVEGISYNLGDTRVSYTFEPIHDTLDVVFTPHAADPGYGDGQAINISVRATDIAGNVGTGSWAYTIDLTPPTAGNENPANRGYTNDELQPISIEIDDRWSGVEPSSIRLYVNSATSHYDVGSSEVTYSGNVLEYTPVVPFAHGDVVEARLNNVQDKVGNLMADYEWSFTVDLEAPAASNENPADGSYSNRVRQPISLTLEDALSGIDESTIVMEVNGTPYYTGMGQLDFNADGTGRLIYTPSSNFGHLEIVEVEVAFSDNAGNGGNYNWVFRMDLEAPYLENINPADNAWSNDLAQAISAELADSGSGIDEATIGLTVGTTTYTAADSELSFTRTTDLVAQDQPIIGINGVGSYEGEELYVILAGVADYGGRYGGEFRLYDTENNLITSAVVYEHEVLTDSLKVGNERIFGEMLRVSELGISGMASEGYAWIVSEGLLEFTPASAIFNNGQVVDVQLDVNDFADNRSSVAWRFTIDTVAPNGITGLTAEFNNNDAIYLEWSTPVYQGAPIEYYNVYRSLYPITSSNAGSAYATTTDTFYLDTEIELHQRYYYRVTSVDAAGNESELSNEAYEDTFAAIILTSDYGYVSLEPGETQGVELRLENTTSEQVNVRLEAYADYAEVKPSLGKDEVWLNANEYTLFTLSILAEEDAEVGVYDVVVVFEYDGVVASKTIRANVLGDGGVDFILPSERPVFCNEGYTKRIAIEVVNNTLEFQEVELIGVSEPFMPLFEPAKLRLDAGEGKMAELVIRTNSTTKAGIYDMPIFVRNERVNTERAVSFEIVDCEYTEAFSIEGPDSCYFMGKEEDLNIAFTITNQLAEKQEFTLYATGELTMGLGEREIELGPYESATKTVTIKTRDSDRNGNYDIKFYAMSTEGYRSTGACITVGPSHGVAMRVLTDEIDRSACSATDFAVFEVELQNTGDYTETIYLHTENPYGNIGTTVSDSIVELGARSSEIVHVSVNPSYDTPLGAKTVYLIASSRPSGIPEQSLVFDLDGFTEDVNRDTILFTVSGTAYDEDDEEMDYIAGTETVVFEEESTELDGMFTVNLDFEDTLGNRYVIDTRVDADRNDTEIRQITFYLDGLDSIAKEYSEFMLNGEYYNDDNSEFHVYADENRITIDIYEDFANNESIGFWLYAENEGGDFLEVSGSFSIDFSSELMFYDRAPLTFNVVEPKRGVLKDVIEITNYPRDITIERGEKKQISITVYNPTNEPIENLAVRLWGVGNGVSFPVKTITEIGARQSKTITATLMASGNARKDRFGLTLEASSSEHITTEDVGLEVVGKGHIPSEGSGENKDNEATDIVGGMLAAGLASLGNSGGYAIGILLLICLGVLYILSLNSGKTETKQKWLYYK